MSLENPTIVQATSNTVTVVVNPALNQIAVVEPQRGATVVRDSVIRGPEGPSGPSGPAAFEAYDQANAAYNKANSAYSAANLKLNIAGGTLTGTLNVQNIIPSLDSTYDLGTPTKRFKDLYLTSSTIYLGNTEISGNANTLTVTDNAGNTIILNAGAQFITVGNTTLSGNGLDTEALNVSTDASITGNLAVGGNITLNGNLIIGNVNTDTISVVADFTSDIVPDTSDTFDLGKEGKRWDELHVRAANVVSVNLSGDLTTSQNSTIIVGATTVNTSYVSANVIVSGPTETTYNVFTTNADTPITIDSFPSPSFTTVKYIIQSKSIDGYHSTELFCMQDGITAYLTEYATLINNYTLGSYSLTVSGGICNLIFHPNNPMNNIITVKLVRTAITA